jgi:hypothetical protein
MPSDRDRELFVGWLSKQVIADARGDRLTSSPTKPADRLWLGRLAPEDASWKIALGQRGQRLDPCSCGFRFRSKNWSWTAGAAFYVWQRDKEVEGQPWIKSQRVELALDVELDPRPQVLSVGADQVRTALEAHGITTHGARIDFVVEPAPDADDVLDVTAVLVNTTSSEQRGVDTNLYEVRLALEVGNLEPIYLDALPDSFRYNRRVDAFGVYGGYRFDGQTLSTTDVVVADKSRPGYWDEGIGPQPDLEFKTLAADPVPQLQALVEAHARWGDRYWSAARLVGLSASRTVSADEKCGMLWWSSLTPTSSWCW